MSQKLLNKYQALALMMLGMKLRNILWDNPYHHGCAYVYVKEGTVWCSNTEAEIEDSTWLTLNDFKDNDRLKEGWYIYELQSS